MAELGASPELYFMRRLATIRRAQALSASMAFDLARSPLDDDELEQIVDSFEGRASASGFGFSEILREVLSREPRKIPVGDLRRLQQNLISQGYAPPDAEATGVWDPSWYAYFRRWDRDNYEQVIAGKHWGAAPIEAGFRLITNTLPSRVWQGLIGAAKGLAQQAPETLERGGLVGGAAAGAAIGGTLASVIPGLGTLAGAGVGATIGGVAGFLADLFGQEEGEEDQSTTARLLDALSPYEEYRDQGWRAFWEDLGAIGTATSLIAGAGLAVRGVAAGIGGIRALAAGQVPGAAPGVTAGVTPITAPGITAGATPGAVMPTLRAALARPPGAQLGIAGQVIRAATRRYLPGSAGWLEQQMLRFGPFANLQRPALMVVNKAYTGLSAAQLGARLAAGFDLGTGVAGRTTIEKAIVETDPLQSGITLPFFGDLVDWAAFVLVPEQFLPLRARQLGQAATRLMGDTMLAPFGHALQHGTNMSLRQAIDLAKEVVTPELNTYMRLDYGIHTEALRLVRETGIKGGYNAARAQVIRDLKADVNRAVQVGPATPPKLIPVKHDPITDLIDRYYGSPALSLSQMGEMLPRGDYLYHSTADANLLSIAREGLKPGKVRPGETTGVYFAEDGLDVLSLRPGRPRENDVFLRVRRDQVSVKATDMYPPESGFTEWVSLGPVSAEKIEYLGEDGAWHPIKELLYGARKPGPPQSPMVSELLARSLANPRRFEAWLIELAGKNRGVDIVTNWAEASKLARAVTRDVRGGRILVTERPAAFVAGPEGLEIGAIRGRGFDELALKRQATELERQVKRLERAAARAVDPQAVRRLTQEARRLREQLNVVRRQAKAAPQYRQAGQLNVVPARQDFLTRKDLYARRDEYLRLVQEVESTWAGQFDAAHTIARQKLARFVQELAADGYIPDSVARKIVEAGAKPGRQVADLLEEAAQHAARDVELPPELMEQFAALGYKPVVTGEDVIQLHEIGNIAEVFGVGDYTRRAALWETLGLSPRWTKDEDIFALRVAHERAELEQVFAEHNIPLSGGQAITRLRERLTELNHRGVVIGPVVKPLRGRPHPYLVDVRQLTPDDILSVFEDIQGFNDDVAREVYAALKRGAAFGGEAKLGAPIAVARSLGHALRISGLPGFADFIRTARVPVTSRMMAALSGAAVGAAAGAVAGDEPGDILKGALGGAALGVGFRSIAKRTYGYLPDYLARINTALRYTFSFTFDAGRYTEQNLIAAAQLGLPPILAPKRYIASRAWRSPYSAELVRGEEAWRHASQFWDEINGTAFFVHIDDTDRRLFQAGMLGFSPRNFEAAQAFMLYQRGWSKEKIREAISKLGRYGLGRTAFEKSANFIFFPFSFSKKLLTSLGDFMLQAPARNLLLYEGLRRYHESSLDERLKDLVNDHLPLLEKLWQVNNLAFGLSPGRFFLEGLDDHRTAVGKVAQVLASVFIPSGAATPLAQAAGGAGDLLVHAFIPVVITGESIDRAGGVDGLDDILRRYIPMIREIDDYFVRGEGGKVVGGVVGEQIAAATSPGFRAPYAQLTGYLDEVRSFKADLQPLALALGYSSVDGFLASDIGAPMQARYEQLKEELRARYPSGWRLVTNIEDTALIDQAALNDLAREVAEGRASPAEEAILDIAQNIEVLRFMNGELGVPSEVGDALIGLQVRSLARRWQRDRRFAELYDRFFAREYGPIRAIAA